MLIVPHISLSSIPDIAASLASSRGWSGSTVTAPEAWWMSGSQKPSTSSKYLAEYSPSVNSLALSHDEYFFPVNPNQAYASEDQLTADIRSLFADDASLVESTFADPIYAPSQSAWEANLEQDAMIVLTNDSGKLECFWNSPPPRSGRPMIVEIKPSRPASMSLTSEAERGHRAIAGDTFDASTRDVDEDESTKALVRHHPPPRPDVEQVQWSYDPKNATSSSVLSSLWSGLVSKLAEAWTYTKGRMGSLTSDKRLNYDYDHDYSAYDPYKWEREMLTQISQDPLTVQSDILHGTANPPPQIGTIDTDGEMTSIQSDLLYDTENRPPNDLHEYTRLEDDRTTTDPESTHTTVTDIFGNSPPKGLMITY
ncbi:uncharacterized protein I303_102111 [Kwoniella dejecticola CBS 10117]|uniref:Uncharacterized protein n=1 Tax=Kwoniella dejecticola CBS 10117 TaxID=1296121 RepID=A0A1A6ABW1_9TREE|nr:uncharacterized protein I303_01748 [Kwoniella dejecticola CBS 10117]OBR87540.1 hypothetical protein I303_01748 [Kwoniella dejecticola CBS 10117]